MFEKFFSHRDRWGNRPPLWVVLFMLFALPILVLEVSRVRLNNDVSTWLPVNDPDSVVLSWFHDHFEHEGRMLISWDGSSLSDPRVGKFADALRGDGEFAERFRGQNLERIIGDVSTPLSAMDSMLSNKLSPEEAVDRLTGVLIGSGFLKVRLSEAGRQNEEQAQEAIQAAAVAAGFQETLHFLPPVPSHDASPETAIIEDVEPAGDGTIAELPERTPAEEFAEQFKIPVHDLQIRAAGLSAGNDTSKKLIEALTALEAVDSCFYAAGSPIAISVALTPEGEEHLKAAFGHITAAADAAGIPRNILHLGGGPVSRYRLDKEGDRALWNPEYPVYNAFKRSPIILSTVVTIILAFVLLRSVRLAMLVLAASMYTTISVVALLPVMGTSLNMVLIVLPNLLMVLTTSGAIHLANYWKHEVAIKREGAIGRAVQLAFMPCLLASVTTAIGMASLMTSTLSPVQDFGLYAAIGCLLSLLMILLGFPSMMTVWPGKHESDAAMRDGSDAWSRIGAWLVGHSSAVTFVCLALFAVSCYGLRWFQTETKVIRYFPPHTQIYKDYEYLEEGLAGIVSVEAVIHFPKHADADTEGSRSSSTSNVLERMELVRRIEQRLSEHPGVSGTISLSDFRPVSPRPGEPSLVRYAALVRRTERGIFEDHQEETKGFTRYADSSLSVMQQGQLINFAPGDELWRIRCQTAVLNDINYDLLIADLRQIVAEEVSTSPGVDFVITGMVPLFLRTQQAVLRSLIESFALAFGLIAIVMMFLLRHPVSGLIAMLPNLFPVGVVFGIVSWLNIPIDIGTMITASVALGIAIDGTLHLLTWFQEGIRDGLTRDEAIIKAMKHCGPAMWQTSVAIALGMLMLVGADLLLISRFGWLMAALILVALLGDVILLPALLKGWLGTIVERTTKQRPGRPDTDAGPKLQTNDAPANQDHAKDSEDSAEREIVSIPLSPAPEGETRRFQAP